MSYIPASTYRAYTKELSALNINGRPCEVCERPCKDHEWIDLDPEGFAVACSNNEARKVNK